MFVYHIFWSHCENLDVASQFKFICSVYPGRVPNLLTRIETTCRIEVQASECIAQKGLTEDLNFILNTVLLVITFSLEQHPGTILTRDIYLGNDMSNDCSIYWSSQSRTFWRNIIFFSSNSFTKY